MEGRQPRRALAGRGAPLVRLVTLLACIACGAGCGGAPRGGPASMAASGPRQLRLQAPITDRIGTEDVKVLRFVLGPVMSVPPDRPFVVPGHRYVFEPPAPGDYTLEVRPACPDCPVHPRCSGFEVLPAPGSGLYGGCGTLLAFDVEGTDAIRFTVSERDSPTGPSDLPRSLCGDYVVELRPGVPECLRPSSAR